MPPATPPPPPIAMLRAASDRHGETAARAAGRADPARLAALSKPATATAVPRLIEAGTLDADVSALARGALP